MNPGDKESHRLSLPDTLGHTNIELQPRLDYGCEYSGRQAITKGVPRSAEWKMEYPTGSEGTILENSLPRVRAILSKSPSYFVLKYGTDVH